MELFHLMSKHFWFVAVLVTVINGFIFRKRAQRHIEENPQLEAGYRDLLRGYLFWMNVPWIVMGIGCTIGGVPSVWHFFRPRDGNLYVMAWYASVFLLWMLGTFWLFFRGGAETLVRYPGMVEFRYGLKAKDITNPLWIKVFWLLALVCGIVAVASMWYIEIPILNTDI